MSGTPNPSYRVVSVAQVRDLTMALCYSKNTGEFCYAGTDIPIKERFSSDPEAWSIFPLRPFPDLRNIHPQFLPARMSEAKAVPDPTTYIKKQDYFAMADFLGGIYNLYLCKNDPRHNLPAQITMREICVCELLKANPHRNIAEYRGVLTTTSITHKTCGVMQSFRSPVMTGIAFKRYDRTLLEVVEQSLKRPFDAFKAITDIEKGVRHMHTLGLVHADLKPSNIFVDYRNQPFNPNKWVFVVGDFDSTHRIGEIYDKKVGTPGWTIDFSNDFSAKAEAEHYFYSIRVIQLWLEMKGWGKMEKGMEYPSTVEILGCFRREDSGVVINISPPKGPLRVFNA